MTLADTEEYLRKAEMYDSRAYAPEYMDDARGGVRTAESQIQGGRDKEALATARAARFKASEAFRIARRSRVAVSLKNARDAIALVNENGAALINRDVYDQMLDSLEKAERLFMTDELDSSFEHSKEVIYQAEILLEPLRKEAEQKKENILKRMESARQAGRKPGEVVESLRKEAEAEYAVKNFRKAIDLWDKIDLEIRGI
jgi:tetratricopeptide (TPR) repeat protein